MLERFSKNCCDGIYNSFDVHFTGSCDNKCAHCIDNRFYGVGVKKPDIHAISKTIIDNSDGYDDVLFLGGEPCLYLDELIECIRIIKSKTNLKIYVTTSVPKVCFDKRDTFISLIEMVDGINLSVQHYDECVADEIRKTKSKYDRQSFYDGLPSKHKIRINLNIVKPYLYTRADISNCIIHYDKMGFNEIKLSEIQHGSDCFVSFENIFGIKLKSPYYHGCQNIIDTSIILPTVKTPLLLKRSCFMCEDTLKASVMDGIKVLYKYVKPQAPNRYGVVYENGLLTTKWK